MNINIFFDIFICKNLLMIKVIINIPRRHEQITYNIFAQSYFKMISSDAGGTPTSPRAANTTTQ